MRTDDPPGLSGLAHFFEHMMFRGTTKVKGDQFAQTVARNGGESNAFTTHDYTAFYEQIAKDRLATVMDLEADRFETEVVDVVGTRHRSAYRFCAAVAGSLAVVVSQDGGVRFATKHRGQVTWWEHNAGDEQV